MRHDLELAARLLQEVDVLGVGDDRLAKVDGAVHHALLLLALKDAWNGQTINTSKREKMS